MRQPGSPIWVAILMIAALFIICNCAGYLVLTVTDSSLLAPEESTSLNLATPVIVVAFVTPTPAPPGSTGPVVVVITPTPAPLLPTVTPGGQPTAIVAAPAVTAPPPPTALPVNPPPVVKSSPTSATTIRGVGLSSALEILSHQSYVDGLGWHHIVGEVQNSGSIPLEFVEVIARLYDEDEKLVSTKITFTAPDVIYPGGKAPFDIITLRQSQWSRMTHYELQVKGDTAEELMQQSLILLNQNSYIEDGYLYVAGEVQNTGATPALVKLIVTLYDADHNVVNTDWSYADLGIIRTDDISPFEVKIRHRADPDNYNYRIQIEEALMTSAVAGEQDLKTK